MCKVMNDGEEDMEREPIMQICEICSSEDEIEFMLDCPKYSEDIGKGIIPGWIHEQCCEESFKSEPDSCIESCDNENLFRNIAKYFEDCVKVEGLVKTEKKGVPIFMSHDNIFGITPHMDKFLESFKPLNIVTNFFLDKENDMVYIKDNQKNTNVYSLPLYTEIEDRFLHFGPLSLKNSVLKTAHCFWYTALTML